MKKKVANRVGVIRTQRGTGAARLAGRIGVTRQTIYAIEAGTYVPNTEVALKLARELEVTVDELFSLGDEREPVHSSLDTEVLSPVPVWQGQPVKICRVESRWISVPVSAAPYYMPEADALVGRTRPTKQRAEVLPFAGQEEAQKRLVLAGCDPATGLLARMVEKISGVEIVSAAASSKLALTWLTQDKVHIAGSHLEDQKSGEFNLPFLRRQFPGEDFCVITFARWEEGLVTAPGNPKGVRTVEDLASRNVRFVNREPGSGSRALIDRLLKTAGMGRVRITGYDQVAYGHLAAAWSVVTGNADVCLATRSAAKAFALDFIPLKDERYDFVMRKSTAALPAVQALLDVLQRAVLRRQLEALAGYDTSATGALVA